jgi:hypothetical protein
MLIRGVRLRTSSPWSGRATAELLLNLLFYNRPPSWLISQRLPRMRLPVVGSEPIVVACMVWFLSQPDIDIRIMPHCDAA